MPWCTNVLMQLDINVKDCFPGSGALKQESELIWQMICLAAQGLSNVKRLKPGKFCSRGLKTSRVIESGSQLDHAVDLQASRT